jgi:hypothetical protein
MTTITNDQHGRPQVYQASSSQRFAPGGVKETCSTVRDSRTGLQQMSVGRHIHDRGHVLQKSRNDYTRQEEESEEYVNIEENDLPTFNNEWQRRTSRYRPIEIEEINEVDEPQAISAPTEAARLALPAPEHVPPPTRIGRVRSLVNKVRPKGKKDKKPYRKNYE